MINKKGQKALLVFGALSGITTAYGGGEISKIGGAIILGVATGGIGLAVGAPMAAAATAAATAAIGAAAGGNVRSGVRMNGAGQATAQLHIADNRGHPLVNMNANPRGINAHNTSNVRAGSSTSFTEAARIASSKFTGWSPRTTYDILAVNNNRYYRAKNGNEEFLTLSVSRGWSKTSRNIIGTHKFAYQPWNLTFETTPYKWFFEYLNINGKDYVHAYSDSLIDFMVPKDQRYTICAPKRFVDQFNLEKEKKANKYLTPVVQNQCQEKIKKHAKTFAQMFLEEATWSSLNADRAIRQNRFVESKTFANSAINYYEKAIEALKPVGYFVDDVLKEMATPGGIDALQRYRNGEISAAKYDTIVRNDIASDVAASALGSIIGTPTLGAAGAVAGGPAGAAVGANIGAAKGAAAGYIASRAAKAISRATVNFFNGNGPSGSSGKRTVANSSDADRYFDGLNDEKVLSEKIRTRDGHDCWKIEKKCEYLGQTFRKGDYISRDTLHHEWEFFRGPKNHLGAINSLTGILNTAKRDKSRVLRLP